MLFVAGVGTLSHVVRLAFPSRHVAVVDDSSAAPTAPPTSPASQPSGVSPTGSKASPPVSAAVPDIQTIRGFFRDGQPINGVRAVTLVLEVGADTIAKDQALVELEQNMEKLDRTALYQVIDEYQKKAATPAQQHAAQYMKALVASKTFLYERHDPRMAQDLLGKLADVKDSPLAALALNKLGMLMVGVNPTEAVSVFSRQIRDFPDCPLNGFASLMIGTCYRALEQDQRALAQYRETLEKYKGAYGEGGLPLEPYVRHALADTMIKTGDIVEARKELQAIVKSFKEYPYMSIIDETLQSLPVTSTPSSGGK